MGALAIGGDYKSLNIPWATIEHYQMYTLCASNFFAEGYQPLIYRE